MMKISPLRFGLTFFTEKLQMNVPIEKPQTVAKLWDIKAVTKTTGVSIAVITDNARN